MGSIQKGFKSNSEIEKILSSRILKITMLIKEHYPELSKYIEEMKETIPDKKNPEITLKNLRAYYNSLQSMVRKYMKDHPKKLEKIHR